MPLMDCTPWPIVWPCDITDYAEPLVEAAQESAQTLLWSLTGRRYGLCSTTESYRLTCNSPCANPYGDYFGPGVEYRLGDELGRRLCCRIHLAQRPVRSLDSVTALGTVLDPAEYALERDVLFRLGECWPCGQECDAPPVEVTYTYGIDPPAIAGLAMGELACEFLRAFAGADCRLPSNVVSISRQGISLDLGDAQTLFEMGRIGLPISDAFIRSVNPNKLQSMSQVFSPDLARRAR